MFGLCHVWWDHSKFEQAKVWYSNDSGIWAFITWIPTAIPYFMKFTSAKSVEILRPICQVLRLKWFNIGKLYTNYCLAQMLVNLMSIFFKGWLS